MNELPKMETLQDIVDKLDDLFGVRGLDKDPAMSRFIPMVYDPLGFDWKNFFEPDFCERFNGLMIKGADEVGQIFLASFPTEEVLQNFLSNARKGDLLFLHHPINMECGDPRGEMGKGFLPVKPETLKEIKDRGLSVYACHAPMDTNRVIGTNEAIREALVGRFVEEFLEYGNGYAGIVCEIDGISLEELKKKCQEIFGLPYIDFVGKEVETVKRIAIVAGGGGDASDLEEMEKHGVDVGITGEVTAKIASKRGDRERAELQEFYPRTKIAFIGVSHAASEFLVMRTQMKRWVEEQLGLVAIPLSESKWWR